MALASLRFFHLIVPGVLVATTGVGDLLPSRGLQPPRAIIWCGVLP